MTARVAAVATALPVALPQSVATKWALAVSGRNGRRRLIPAVYRRVGVQRRHSVLVREAPLRQEFFAPARDDGDRGPTTGARMRRYAAAAGPLALEAARGLDVGGVTHLVTVSCTGFHAPGFDVELVRGLPLSPDVERTHVGFMGCHGLLNGLRVAKAFVEADPSARVLVCAVELCSLHYDYAAQPRGLVANALFADGAAALLVDASPGPWALAATGAGLFPGADLMRWSIGDHGFGMELSARVPDAIRAHVVPWLRGWMKRHGVRDGDASWAVHPGGPRVLDAMEQALALPRSATAASRDLLESHGNMSSVTLAFLLRRLRATGARLPCIALGFGPGLAVEAALLR